MIPIAIELLLSVCEREYALNNSAKRELPAFDDCCAESRNLQGERVCTIRWHGTIPYKPALYRALVCSPYTIVHAQAYHSHADASGVRNPG